MQILKKALCMLVAVTLVCTAFMLTVPGAQAVTDAAGGQAYADAAKLFIRENKYYGNVDIYFSIYIRNATGSRAWCADFVSAVAKLMNISTSVIPHSAGADRWSRPTDSNFHSLVATLTTSSNTYDWQANGTFDPTYVPKVGDIVTMCWNSSSLMRADHVGIVISVNTSAKTFTYVSGNYTTTVRNSGTYPYGSAVTPQKGKTNVLGFFHPNWSAVSSYNKPIAMTSVSFFDDTITLAPGGSYTVPVSFGPSNALCPALIWTSSNTSVATVEKYSGNVTAVGVGSATITAKAIADGKNTSTAAVQDSLTVIVEEPNQVYDHPSSSVYYPDGMGEGEGYYYLEHFRSNWSNSRTDYFGGTIKGTDLVSVSVYICDVDENNNRTYWCGENGHGSGRSATISGSTSVDIVDVVNQFTWTPQAGKYWTWIVVNTEDSQYQYFGDIFEIRDVEPPEPTVLVKYFNRPTGSAASRVALLQETFSKGPAGKAPYWNNWNVISGDTHQWVYVIDNDTAIQFGISDTPSSGSNVSDNRYWGAWHGTKGCGFARTMFDLCWNMDTEADSYEYAMSYKGNDTYFVDYISPGDMIFTGSMYYFVTGVTSSTITYAQVNKNGNCDISWGNTMSKADLRSALLNLASSQYPGYIASPTPKSFASDVFVYEAYEVTDTSISFKGSTATSSNAKTKFSLSKGATFQAATNRTRTDVSGNIWTYCKNSSGQYGWAIITGKAQKVNVVVYPTRIVPSETNISFPVNEDFVGQGYGYYHTLSLTVEPENADYIEYRFTSTNPNFTGSGIENNTKSVYIYCYATEDESAVITISAVDENGAVKASANVNVSSFICTHLNTAQQCQCWQKAENGLYEVLTFCLDCGYESVSYVTDPIHTFENDWRVVRSATCAQTGIRENTCTVCGETIQEELPKLAHTVVTDAAIVATCTTAGKTEGSHCSVCGTVLTAQTEIPPTGHTPGEWVVVTEPTTTSVGLKEQRCIVCGIVVATEEMPIIDPDPDPDPIPEPAVQTVSAKKGDTVTLNVCVSSKAAYSIIVVCTYDANVFEFISSDSDQGVTANGRFTVFKTDGIVNGKIGTITLKLKDTVGDGKYQVNAKVEGATDLDENMVQCKAAVDKVEVSSRLSGDVNDDGVVDVRDLMRLAKHFAGFGVTISTSNSDVTGDGMVDVRDLMRLAKFFAGFNVILQ